MDLHKYVTIDTLKKILNGSIRFTQPGAFNDPFEMLPELHVSKKNTDQQISIQFDLFSPRREPPIGELPENFHSENCSDINSRKILSELNNSVGLLCLSENYNSLLMWSHYADEHQGALITFNKDHEFFDGKIEVHYRKNRPKKDVSSYLNDNEPIPLAELCVKPSEWEYESEIRIARCLSQCKLDSDDAKYPVYVMDIPLECIKTVTLGERTPVPQQREIWELIKNTHISMFLAAVANWGYQFRDELIKYNVPISEKNPVLSPRTAHIFTHLDSEIGEMARWLVEKHKFSEIVNHTV